MVARAEPASLVGRAIFTSVRLPSCSHFNLFTTSPWPHPHTSLCAKKEKIVSVEHRGRHWRQELVLPAEAWPRRQTTGRQASTAQTM